MQSAVAARFVVDIHTYVILDCGQERPEAFPVGRILIIVPVGKTVIVIEVVWQVKGWNVGKGMIDRIDLFFIQEKADLIVQQDRSNVCFLQVGERDIEVGGQPCVQITVPLLIKSPLLPGQSGQQVENAFCKTGVLDAGLKFLLRQAGVLGDQGLNHLKIAVIYF